MIEILCTVTGIVAGIAIVTSLYHYQGQRAKFETKPQEVDAEKIRGIADQLQVISHRVAADVSAHSTTVEQINGRLCHNTETSPQVVLSIQEIVRANESMQGQLASAQKRIAQQTEMIEQASRQARTDALTGLSNRRALDEFLTNSLASLSEDEFTGLLLLDIDHFKSFNDSFGHTTGDAVLASFARSIQKSCGQECYSARYGGEEFAVVVHAASVEALVHKAAYIRHYISDQVINHEDLQLKITASGGLCLLQANDVLQAVFERADGGLYKSKKAGRNCGHWLNNGSWNLFPPLAQAVEASPQPAFASQRPPAPANQDPPAAKASGLAEAPTAAAQENPEQDNTSEVLDLQTFLGRLETSLDQLRRADLPAAAIMVEAHGLPEVAGRHAASHWEAVVDMVQDNLRGIDVVCLFRPLTLCIFMPGCSTDAGVDRASKIQHCLQDRRDTWPTEHCPAKLAISIASFHHPEDVAHFLNRLEKALDEAQDAAVMEVVVHHGESSHFQTV